MIAVKITDYGVIGGLLGSFSDGTTVTDSSWRCSRTFYDGWTAPNYDDSSWPFAVASRGQGDLVWGIRPGVAASARWIWSGSYTTDRPPVTVYCRKRISKTCNLSWLHYMLN